jgi:phage recombination protein Bet
MNEITTTTGSAVATVIDEKKIREYLESFGLVNGMSDREVKQFTEIAQAFQLNPFKREIYCIPYGTGDRRRLSIITGYEVYLKRAERLGTLGGWKAWTEGDYKVQTEVKELPGKGGGTYKKTVRLPKGNMRAIVEIHRKDWTQPFTHEVYLDEYAQENEMWADKPRTMLKKVAIAQAFRMAFPDEMGGMPYTKDELPDEMTNVTEPVQEAKEPVIAPKEALARQTPEIQAVLQDIAGLLKESDGEVLYFSMDEVGGYREEAGKILKSDSPLEGLKTLKAKITGTLFGKQDEHEKQKHALDAAAEAGFDEKQPEIF